MENYRMKFISNKLFNLSVRLMDFSPGLFLCRQKNWKSCQTNFSLRTAKKNGYFMAWTMPNAHDRKWRWNTKQNENNGFYEFIYIPLIWNTIFFSFGYLVRGKKSRQIQFWQAAYRSTFSVHACRDCGNGKLIFVHLLGISYLNKKKWCETGNCAEIIFYLNYFSSILHMLTMRLRMRLGFFFFASWLGDAYMW